jgi:hypothetical protein
LLASSDGGYVVTPGHSSGLKNLFALKHDGCLDGTHVMPSQRNEIFSNTPRDNNDNSYLACVHVVMLYFK